MKTDVVHRLIEQQAAASPDALAYDEDRRLLTYRELNSRANAVARALVASGFKRGTIAAVQMPRSADLAITLLAVLKAGGAYMYVDGKGAGWPDGVSLLQRTAAESMQGLSIDLAGVLGKTAPAGPNLPILTRGSDLACVLMGRDGAPGPLVPHSTITALQPWQNVHDLCWSRESGAFDLWLALMNGATVTSVTAAPQLAA
jgi:hypothetical protein